MKRLIDIQCEKCETQLQDVWRETSELGACEACGDAMTRLYVARTGAAIGDDIPGGVLMPNAICWPNGTPKRYYSKSEIAKAAKEAGYSNIVEHKGSKGSDKSKHTTRWY